MLGRTVPRVKICCIQNIAEARLAIRYGASALGLVSAMPSGPGPIPDEEIGLISAIVPPGVSSVLLTSITDPASIVEQQRRCRVNALQICDRLEKGSHRALRKRLPGLALLQALHVTGEESVGEALEVADQVDALLLDSGQPDAAVNVLGGTGRVHNWEISRRIREAARVPVYLAGGLRAENVAAAIETVEPFGVDVCTGVRTNGALSEEKLAAFMRPVAGSTPS